jgi:MFS family permease
VNVAQTGSPGAPPQAPPKRSLWRNRDFMLLWTGQSANLTGTQVSQIAIPLIALSVLHASPFQVSLLAAMEYLPYVLIALPAGAIVDRHRRRSLIVWCCLLQALILATVPLAIAAGTLTLTQLVTVALLVAALAVVFDSASQSYLPTLLQGEELIAGNGRFGASIAFATVVGQSVAGWLVSAVGAAWTVAIDALSYLANAGSVQLIKAPEPARHPTTSRMRTQIGEGLRFVFGHRLLRPVVLANTTASAAIGASWSMWVVYVVRDLHWPMAAAGLCQGVAAIGGILGGLCTRPLAQRLGLPRLMLITSPCYILDLIPTLLVRPGLTGQVIVGAGYFLVLAAEFAYVSANSSFRQLICPPELLGRMTATTRWLTWGARPIFALLSGVLAATLGTRTALLVGVGLFALPSAILTTSPLRRVGKSGTTDFQFDLG